MANTTLKSSDHRGSIHIIKQADFSRQQLASRNRYENVYFNKYLSLAHKDILLLGWPKKINRDILNRSRKL